MEWEFAYVDLWLGTNKTLDAVGEQKTRIAELGKEGWEPLGRIQFDYETAHLVSMTVPQLMFKRPASN
jgi:hypothetical protein